MQIRIEASDFPGTSCGPGPDALDGYCNVHVGVQRRSRPDDLLDLVPGDSSSAIWTVECNATAKAGSVDLKGPYIQGPPGGRFIYLSWGTVDADGFDMFRRAKLMLDAVPATVLSRAMHRGVLVGRLGMTDGRGGPVCAAVRPPSIEWSAEAPSRTDA
jgi:Family of unknown function (DUF5990)